MRTQISAAKQGDASQSFCHLLSVNARGLSPNVPTCQGSIHISKRIQAFHDERFEMLAYASIENGLLKLGLALQLHAAAQAYTHKVKGKDGVQSGSQATSHDEGDLYFVNPDGEFIASYGPNAEPKQIGKEFSDVMKVCTQAFLQTLDLSPQDLIHFLSAVSFPVSCMIGSRSMSNKCLKFFTEIGRIAVLDMVSIFKGAQSQERDLGASKFLCSQAYKLSHPTWMGPKAVKTRHA